MKSCWAWVYCTVVAVMLLTGCAAQPQPTDLRQDRQAAPRILASFFERNPDAQEMGFWLGGGEDIPWGCGLAKALHDDTHAWSADTELPTAGWGHVCEAMIVLYGETEAIIIWLDPYGFSLGGAEARFYNPTLAKALREQFKLERLDEFSRERGENMFRRAAGELPPTKGR
jgi:hypothetical protein